MTNPGNDQPLLGLATTRQLLEEIAARGRVEYYAGPYHDLGLEMEAGALELIDRLPGSLLDYRTVDA